MVFLQPQFGAVIGGDIGGRGSARFQAFYEKTPGGKPAFNPLDERLSSKAVEFQFTGPDKQKVYESWAKEILALVRDQAGHYQKDPIRAIGLAFPGSIKGSRIVQRADNLSENTGIRWENIDIQAEFAPVLKKIFTDAGHANLLADSVTVAPANDLVAGMLGERAFGKARHYEPATQGSDLGVISLYQVGTGLGGSTLTILPAVDAIHPGEPGQEIRRKFKKQQIVEDHISHRAVKRLGEKAGFGPDPEPKKVIRAAFDASHPQQRAAEKVIKKLIKNLAAPIASTVQKFNTPQQVVLGGGIVQQIEKAGGPGTVIRMLTEELAKRTRPPELANVQFAISDFQNNLIGAAVLADTARFPQLSPKGRTVVIG